MSRRPGRSIALLTVALSLGALSAVGCAPAKEPAPPPLVGAWRSSIQFQTGVFSSIRDLEFLYSFNLGGSMTESSNYDGAPPVPPAYGVWRQIAPDVFETRYEFFVTKAPAASRDLPAGWMPAGRGVFVEKITLAPDHQSFTSTIAYEAVDLSGKSVPGGGEATGKGTRISFPTP